MPAGFKVFLFFIYLQMTFNFTAEAVDAIETELDRPITDIIGNYSVRNLIRLVMAGKGISKAEALKAIDTEFSEGGEMVALYLSILEALQVKGFLPKALDIDKLRAKMTNLKI